MSIKVVFCWSDISGYMAACWRALHQLPDVEIFVLAFQARTETAFTDQLMQDIPCRLLDLQERQDPHLIERLVLTASPDVIVLCGWLHPPYRKLTTTPHLKQVRFVMGMDTPWWGNWKQRLAPWILKSYLQRIDHVVVTGERSWQYAKHLGIPPAQIMRGLYGIDYNAWLSLWNQRSQTDWPRSFLFVGRYVPAKAIDILVQAYRNYRQQVDRPWELVCCGQGVLKSHLQAQSGIIDRGFLQPNEMQAVWQSAGAFLLPSRFDPWPLAIVEAAAAGLPIVCTEVCGSAVEVVRSWYNGLVIPEDNSAALTQAMLTLHHCHEELPLWGRRSQQLAAPYAAETWTTRWLALLQDLCQPQLLQQQPKQSEVARIGGI